MNKIIKITQIKSSIGRLSKHKATLIGLGLKRIGHSVYRKNTLSIQGMIKKVSYMLFVNKE
ncbi:50S ribosomal protein L30 [Buchnera aphidicola (Eriosoma grossulariae)]|uniref:50S ribosomal protein L30 n=1 Tax=Buchnera aphidicola TaxID=9 RepID=UPI003464A5E1